MTILHVLDHSMPVPSGYSSRSRYIVEFQRRLGLRPVVLTSPKHGSAHDGIETIDGIRHYRTGSVGGPPVLREGRLMMRMAARIAAVARAEGARILHAHSPLLNGIPALWAGRRLGLPVVYEARAFWEDAAVDHGTTRDGSFRYRLSRRLETLVFKRADRVVVIAEAMRNEVVHRGVDAARMVVVPNGVDSERFQPMARDEDLAIELGVQGGPVFGFIGSFFRYEGLPFLLSALPEVRRRLPGARVLLVGGGEEDKSLRDMSRSLGSAVVFTGWISHEQVRRFYSIVDVFVCPRRRMRLTELVTPLKPLEAMAMGCALLASDVGGHAELVRHNETGVLFPAESSRALVEAAARLGAAPEARAELASQARHFVASERGWRDVVSRYLPIYGSLGMRGTV